MAVRVGNAQAVDVDAENVKSAVGSKDRGAVAGSAADIENTRTGHEPACEQVEGSVTCEEIVLDSGPDRLAEGAQSCRYLAKTVGGSLRPEANGRHGLILPDRVAAAAGGAGSAERCERGLMGCPANRRDSLKVERSARDGRLRRKCRSARVPIKE